MKNLIVCLFFSFSHLLYGDVHWFNSSSFQERLDQETHSKGHEGNQIKLLVNGDAGMKNRVTNLIDADVILIKTFEFWNDKSGSLLLKLLTERAKAGAKVFIQFDVKGTFTGIRPDSMKDLREGRLSPIPDYLQTFVKESEGNGFVIPTNVPYSLATSSSIVFKDHEKVFVTWKKQSDPSPVRVIMGGMNTGDMYLLGGAKDLNGNFERVDFYQSEGFSGDDALPMRDTDVEIVGTVTEDIVDRFIGAAQIHLNNPNPFFQKNQVPSIQIAIENLKKIQQEMKANSELAFPKNIGNASLRFIYKSVNDFGSTEISNLMNFFRLVLAEVPSRSTVQLATGFFLPPKLLWKAISDAARRSVSFDILVNGTSGAEVSASVLSRTARNQINHFLKTMPAGSVDFYEWRGAPQEGIGTVMHQKVYAFGQGLNDPCAIGSVNLHQLGLYWDSEDLLVIQDPEFKDQFNRMLQKDFSAPYSAKLTIEEIESRDFLEKVKAFLFDKFFRFFL